VRVLFVRIAGAPVRRESRLKHFKTKRASTGVKNGRLPIQRAAGADMSAGNADLSYPPHHGGRASPREGCGHFHKHLQVYVDEFTFRFNRRRTPRAAFQTLLGLGAQRGPTTYRQLDEVESTG
jgi:hypothetical protein